MRSWAESEAGLAARLETLWQGWNAKSRWADLSLPLKKQRILLERWGQLIQAGVESMPRRQRHLSRKEGKRQDVHKQGVGGFLEEGHSRGVGLGSGEGMAFYLRGSAA